MTSDRLGTVTAVHHNPHTSQDTHHIPFSYHWGGGKHTRTRKAWLDTTNPFLSLSLSLFLHTAVNTNTQPTRGTNDQHEQQTWIVDELMVQEKKGSKEAGRDDEKHLHQEVACVPRAARMEAFHRLVVHAV